MRDKLLGYLVGALDDAEHDELKQQLAADPALASELNLLRNGLNILRADDESPTPPSGLAMRTLDFVFAHPATWAPSTLAPAALADAPMAGRAREARLSPANDSPTSSRRLTMSDMMVAAGVIVAASMLFFPAIANSRFQSRLAMCQNNLKHLSQSLLEFSGRQPDQSFPAVAATGKRAVAGIYAPTLRSAGYFADRKNFNLCPASEVAEAGEAMEPPTLEELDQAEGAQLAKHQRTMGGSYAYTLGHVADGKLKPTRNQARQHFAVMADVPCSGRAPCGNTFSANHGQCGQNVLFEDGHVSYLNKCRESSCNDDFYHNDKGDREAGLHADDAVVGSSAAPPLTYISN